SNPKVRDLATPTGNPAGGGTLANASITNNTTDLAPSTPGLVSPADGTRLNTSTPTLTATFSDPDATDTGRATFAVCSTSTCSSSLGTFASSSTTLTVGQNGSGSVPGGLISSDGTYYWRAKNVDAAAGTSGNSAIRSFLVDTTAPTMTAGTVAADGTTLTVTWSENLDQTQAVAGTAFSVTPNGGGPPPGTGAAPTYPPAHPN